MKRVRILHTADWHLGKQLHKYSLEEDHKHFLEWLSATVRERETDLLLVSGDIFDTAFPSSYSLQLYYRFLTGLIGFPCSMVITGGNHDSPGVLNAPREILSHLDIQVAGSITGNPRDTLLVYEKLGLAVAAVPYLREADLRKSLPGQSFEDRTMLIRQGIRTYYESQIAYCREHFPELTVIGMGHLHVSGAETSESEREIHIVGSLAAFGSESFPEGFEYMALGHIHKPQKITDRIRYSGSPVPLSFSERNDPKYVLELVLEDGKLIDVAPIPVPLNRELRTFAGNLETVWTALRRYQPVTLLEPLVELDVTEPSFDPQKSLQFDQMLQEFENAPFRIIKPRLTYENRRKEAADLFATGTEIGDLSPRQVFQKRLENEELDEESRTLLMDAFEELLAASENRN